MKFVFVTEEEEKKNLAAVFAKHPYLEDFEPCADCCSCCAEEEVRGRWGHDAAEAWAFVEEARWLLGR